MVCKLMMYKMTNAVQWGGGIHSYILLLNELLVQITEYALSKGKGNKWYRLLNVTVHVHSNVRDSDQDISTLALKIIWEAPIWRSTADNIIKTFPWANTNFNNQKNACFRSQPMFLLSKYVMFWQTFSWAKCNIFMGKLNCVLLPHECHLTSVVFLLCWKWPGREKGLAR